jgi:Cu+-exporting ATPase
MSVTKKSPHYHMNQGVPVYFCCVGCKDKFAASPEKYSNPPVTQPMVSQEQPPESEVEGTIYTCPMHLEVRRAAPGICLKCGMMLEAEIPSLEDGENPELKDFRRRFISTLPLTVVVTVLAMAGPRAHWFDMVTQRWVQLVA